MKEFFPRQEFQKLGLSEPAIRLLERLTDIKEIGLRAAAMEQALGTIAEGQANTDLATIAAAYANATAAAREGARINSYTAPTIVLSAADVGATATITIASHTRIYPVQGSIDVPDITISAGSVTGLAFSTVYYVYYDDTTLLQTSPTFIATTDIATSLVGAAPGRHFVGTVTTPADGAGGTTGGGGSAPPGGGGGTAIP